VEIDASQFSGKALLIDLEDKINKVDLPLMEDGIALVVNGVLPLSTIKAVFFRTANDLEEYQIRQYANISSDDANLVVNPEMFQGINIDVACLIQTLKKTEDEVGTVTREELSISDSASGILLFLGKFAQVTDFPLDYYAALLNLFINQEKEVSGMLFKEEYAWLCRIPLLHRFGNRIDTLLKNNHLKSPNRNEQAKFNDQLFAHALHQASCFTASTFSPDTYLEAIQDSLEKEMTDEKRSGSMAGITRMKKMMAALLEVRTGQAEKNTLFRTYPADMYPVCATLFLFLSESNPVKILQFVGQFNEFSVSIRAAAVCLSAALYGRTLMPVDCLPDKALIRLISDIMTFQVNHSVGTIGLPKITDEVICIEEKTDHGQTGKLLFKSEVILQRNTAPDSSARKEDTATISAKETTIDMDPVLQNSDSGDQLPDNPDQKAVDSSIIHERTNSAEAVRQKILSSDLLDNDSLLYRIAVEICRSRGWSDLISTCILLRDHEYILENRVGKNELRVPGFVTPEYRIKQVDDLKARLKSMDKAAFITLVEAENIDKMVKELFSENQADRKSTL